MCSTFHTISDSEDENEYCYSSIEKQQFPNSYDQLSSQPLTSSSNSSPQKPKRKRMTKEERLKLKEDQMLMKAEKKKAAEILKQIKPGECIKYITSVIDSGLLTCKFGGELLVTLQSINVQYKIKDQQIPFSITWNRKLPGEEIETGECELVIIWICDELINSVASASLRQQFDKILAFTDGNKNVTLVVYGIEEYFRLQNNNTNRNIRAEIRQEQKSQCKRKVDSTLPLLSRMDIEMSLVELQLMSNVRHRFVETNQELGALIAQFTKAVAEKPYKLDKYRKEQDNIEWYAAGDSKECVHVDNNGNGLLRLWQHQLCQFNLVNTEVAQAIVSQYSSPLALIMAYEKCATKKEAELLLQDIPVRRGHGPLVSTRRVGPELSKKVYLLFNSTDGEMQLSQE